MKTFKNFVGRTLGVAGFALAFLGLMSLPVLLSPALTPTVSADEWPFGRIEKPEPVSGALGSDDSDVAILVRYVGSGSGKVAVAANGDLTFISGTESSEAAETDFECPVSGALGGVIDVSDSACDTMGEVVDTINGYCTGCAGTSSKWRAVLLDAKRADSSNDTLLTISSTAATALNGLSLAWDTDVSFKSTIALTPYRTIQAYIEGNASPGTANRLMLNPFVGQRANYIIGNATSTFGSGTSVYSIDSCAVQNKLGAPGSETCTTLYSIAGGSTTANKVFDYTPYGIMGRKDEKLIARLTNSAAMSTTAHYAYGLSWYYR